MIPIYDFLLVVGEVLVLFILAPLLSGVIQKIKNNIRMRKGPGVFQPYYNTRKLFLKDEVISKTTSWIFYVAPAIVFISSICVAFFVLAFRLSPREEVGAAILIAALFVLGLGRFFLALAGLDAASSFGGMGSSREMFISSFAEPSAFIAVFVLCMAEGVLKVSGLLAGFALLMVVIAETSRVPVDNQETHLELTMIHEAMVLEYSGRSLALIEWASSAKQLVFFILLSWYFFPRSSAGHWDLVLFPAKIVLIGLVISVIEMSLAKMRLFRAVDFLSFSFFIALLACVAAGLGY